MCTSQVAFDVHCVQRSFRRLDQVPRLSKGRGLGGFGQNAPDRRLHASLLHGRPLGGAAARQQQHNHNHNCNDTHICCAKATSCYIQREHPAATVAGILLLERLSPLHPMCAGRQVPLAPPCCTSVPSPASHSPQP